MDWDAYVCERWPLTYAVYRVFSDPSFWILAIGNEYYSWHPDENFPTPEFIARMTHLEDSFINLAPKQIPARWSHANDYPLITKYFSVRETDEEIILNRHHDLTHHNGDSLGWFKMELDYMERGLEFVERAQYMRVEILARLPMPIAHRVVKWLYPL